MAPGRENTLAVLLRTGEDEPGSFYYEYSQDEIDTYCDNISDMSKKLYERYKFKMIFMAIPSKYTIYHTF